LDDGNFHLSQSKVTDSSKSVIAFNYLIELVYLNWPSVWFIEPYIFRANQLCNSLVMVFMHQAISFGGVLRLFPDLACNIVLVVLIHDFLAEPSFFDGLLNALSSRINPLSPPSKTVWRLL